MSCEQGSHWLVLGESGCGKTTLLHLLGGLRKPNGGEIVVQNEDISKINGEALDHFRGQNIGVIFQQSHLIKALTVEENLLTAHRALINDPVLILADEPTSSLDDKNCQEVVKLLLEQSQNFKATLLIVTHDGRLKELFENQIQLETVKEV